jgi:hypothetical protein
MLPRNPANASYRPRGFVVEDHLVNLPEIETIRAQAPQRIFQLPHRDLAVASVRADLGHEEDAVAAIGDGHAHPLFAQAVVVVPGVVEERDAVVDRGVHQAHRGAIGLRHAHVPSAKTDDGHALASTAERARRNAVGRLRHGFGLGTYFSGTNASALLAFIGITNCFAPAS